MLKIDDLLKRLGRRIPKPIMAELGPDYFIDILMDDTLTQFSSYYPMIEKGIVVKEHMLISSENAYQGGKDGICKYAIPIIDELYPFTGISVFDHPMNNVNAGTLFGHGIASASFSRVAGSLNPPRVKIECSFEFPNIITLTPAQRVHRDFTVSLRRVRKLSEVKTGLHESFTKLFTLDCKIALYNEFYHMVDGGTFAGVEMSGTVFSSWESAESDRDTFLQEEFDPHAWKDVDMYGEMTAYGNNLFTIS